MTTSSTGPQFKLLIAEDDREIAALLQKYFVARGLAVTTAHDGEAAWRAFLDVAPDVVLTDLMMPRVSGHELIVRIHGHPTRARTPIIVMAAGLNNAKDEADAVQNLKVEAAFRKPLPLRELLAVIDVHASAYSGKRRAPSSTRLAPVVDRGVFSPGNVPSTPAPISPATLNVGQTAPNSATRAQTRPTTLRHIPAVVHVPSVPTLAMLAAEMVRFFETRATAVVTVTSGSTAREITFSDGLIVDVRSNAPAEREGRALVNAGLLTDAQEEALRQTVQGDLLVETAVQKHALKPSKVLFSLEQHAVALVNRVMLEGGVIGNMEPPRVDPLLRGRFRIDPIKRVMDVCLHLPSDDTARAALTPHQQRRVHGSGCFNERLILLTRLRPESATPGKLFDTPSVEEALQRVSTSTEGVRELLGLVLSQTVLLGGADLSIPPCPRTAVLSHNAWDWDASHLDAHGLAIREAVAREWIRTSASTPRRILNVGDDGDDTQVKQSHGIHAGRFGPPALDDADLGPAKTYLAMVRARRDAAMRALLRIQS